MFAFSREDTDAYYREAGLPLTGVQLEEVMRLTDGWADCTVDGLRRIPGGDGTPADG